MIEKIEYLIKKGHAAIYRCYGNGPYIELPDMLEGYRVEELCDHCFAREASVREKRTEIRTIYRAQWEAVEAQSEEAQSAEAQSIETKIAEAGNADDLNESAPSLTAAGAIPTAGSEAVSNAAEQNDYPEMCAMSIEEIELPKYLVSTGDYCFYGCDNLKKLTFPASFKRLGGGAFVAANHIRALDFYLDQMPENPEEPDAHITPSCMKELLAEVTDELEVKILKPDGSLFYRVHYPGFVEIGLENTPARIIELRFEGMGYKYRLSVKGREIDFAKYDSHFYEATIQELPETVLKLALDRLAFPIHLDEKSKADYIAWLQQEYKALAEYIVPEGRTDMLQVLMKDQYFTQENIEYFLDLASSRKQAEMVPMLMDYKRKNFKVQRKRYSFD